MLIFSTKQKSKSKEICDYYLVNQYFICTKKKGGRKEKFLESNNTHTHTNKKTKDIQNFRKQKEPRH